MSEYDIVIIGLSVTSSWGNGHATTYRSLIKGLAARGHRVLFLEMDVPWYAENRDQPNPSGAVTRLYPSFEDLTARFERDVRDARLVIVGSFVREGARVGEWVTSVARGHTAFYDIDTPVTLAQLVSGDRTYITPELIRRYHAYLSFTGGPLLEVLEHDFGARMARALYCSVDADLHHPKCVPCKWDLGYLGTYSADRQPGLDKLLCEPARDWREGRFAVFGAMYPEYLTWTTNVERRDHVSPAEHPTFYNAQRFTLNITRSQMKTAGYSPSVRLFEAAACATPVISDWWPGIDELFKIGHEILVAQSGDECLRFLRDMPDEKRIRIGHAARERVLEEHTAVHRAIQLEGYLREMDDYAIPDSPRRNGLDQQFDGRESAGSFAEQTRARAGGGPDVALPDDTPRGHLYEPAGSRRGNSPAYRKSAET